MDEQKPPLGKRKSSVLTPKNIQQQMQSGISTGLSTVQNKVQNTLKDAPSNIHGKMKGAINTDVQGILKDAGSLLPSELPGELQVNISGALAASSDKIKDTLQVPAGIKKPFGGAKSIVTIKVLYFAAIRDLIGLREESFEYAKSTAPTLAVLYNDIIKRHQNARNQIEAIQFAVNLEYVEKDYKLISLQDKDEVALIPQISGG